MAKLKYFYGSMGAGKSTKLLQMNYNYKLGHKEGILLTSKQRDDVGVITSRLGIGHKAVIVEDGVDIYNLIEKELETLEEEEELVDYILIDEVQFLSSSQIDDLGRIVDYKNIDVYCFGIISDYRGQLFDGAKRLFELADEKEELQLKTLCWCGRKGIMNSRTKEGYMTYEGEQVMVGDVNSDGYEVLCRKHYFEGVTRKEAEEKGLI